MIALFDRFELALTDSQASAASHAGRCDDDVAYDGDGCPE